MKRVASRVGAAFRSSVADVRADLVTDAELFRALGHGSIAALRRPCQWCLSAEDAMDRVWRGLGLLWAAAGAGWIVVHSPLLLVVVVPAWCAVALRHSSFTAWEEGPAAVTVEAVPPPSDAAFISGLAELLAGRSGVHLRTIAEHFHKTGVETAYGIPEVRAQCAALGIPVKPSVKVAGAPPPGVSSGVNRGDFLAALTPLASTSSDPVPAPPSDPSPAPSPPPLQEAGS